MVERARIQDLNAQQAGNAPTARMAVGGISGTHTPNTNSGYRSGSGMGDALNALGATSAAFTQRENDEDFVNGQLDYMAGKTAADVYAEGNGTSTAGYVSLGIGNKVFDWQSASAEAINTEHFSTDPAEYRKELAAQTATMLEKVGDDPYARATFAKAMGISQGKLAAAQTKAHADYREQKTIGNYTAALMIQADPRTPQSPAQASDHTSLEFVKAKDWVGYATSIQANNAQIESSGGKNMSNDTSSAEGLHAVTADRWIESIKQHRPDLAKGASVTELLNLRSNNQLQKEIYIAETAEGAAELDRAGFPVNPSTSYLQWFLGNGGVKTFLRADVNALISTAVSGKALAANKSVFRHDNGKGGYKTVGQVMAWANEKTGTKNGPMVETSTKQSASPVNFSQYKYAPGTADLDGLLPQTKSRFSAMMDNAPQHIKDGLRIYSGYRSPAHQARLVADNMPKYGAGSRVGEWRADVASMGPEAAGKKWRPYLRSKGLTKMVAMPGGSKHQKGMAMDLRYNGLRLDDKRVREAAEWVRDNAPGFGLKTPMYYDKSGNIWEPWQLELDEDFKGDVGGTGTIGMGAGATIFNNPGLSPAKHRQAVTSAMVMSLGADQGGLYANSGGEAALIQLGATPTQITAVRAAKRAFDERAQGKYDGEYQSAANDLLDFSKAEGTTQDALRAELEEFNKTWNKGDKAMTALHLKAEANLDAKGDRDTKNAMQRIPHLMQAVDGIRDSVAAGEITGEDGVAQLEAMATQEGVSSESLAKSVKTLLDTENARDKALADKAAASFKAAEKDRVKAAEIERMIATNSLSTGTADQIKKGIASERDRAVKQIDGTIGVGSHDKATQTNPADKNNALSHHMAGFLVKQDIIDTATASRMRVNVREPIGPDGKVTAGAKSAFDFYLRMTNTHNATDSYMARMFDNDPATLDFFRDAENIHGGDGSLDASISAAADLRDNPDTRAMVDKNFQSVNTPTLVNSIKEDLIEETGRKAGFWNEHFWNALSGDFDELEITAEQQKFLMDDTGFTSSISAAINAQTMLTPTAQPDSIRRRVMTQLAEGKFIGGSYIPHSPGSPTLRDVMGIRSKEKGTENKALMSYVLEHGEELFGDAVWKDISPSMPFEYRNGTRMHLGTERPELSVKLVGKHFEITPRSQKYSIRDPKWAGWVRDGANMSNPEAQVIRVPARDIGDWFNESETESSFNLNGVFDFLRPLAAQAGEALSTVGTTVPPQTF